MSHDRKMTVNSGNHASNQLCMNYIFLRLCKMSYVNSPKYTIPISFEGTDPYAYCLNECFSQRFISLVLPTEMKTLTPSCDSSVSTVTAVATGKAWRRPVPITHMAVNLLIENIPGKRRKYQGAPVNSATEAAACVKRKDKMTRQKQREVGVGGWEGLCF